MRNISYRGIFVSVLGLYFTQGFASKPGKYYSIILTASLNRNRANAERKVTVEISSSLNNHLCSVHCYCTVIQRYYPFV